MKTGIIKEIEDESFWFSPVKIKETLVQVYSDHDFDSNEEIWMNEYLKELFKHGFIKYYKYHPDPFILTTSIGYMYETLMKTKSKSTKASLLNKHIYTADFYIEWTEKAVGVFCKELNNVKDNNKAYFFCQDMVSYIDVKGSFNGKNNSSALTFPLNQKWTFDKLGVFVQKIIPFGKTQSLFPETFTPLKYILRRHKTTGELLNIKWNPQTLNQFLTNK